jgi:hypothetical protein
MRIVAGRWSCPNLRLHGLHTRAKVKSFEPRRHRDEGRQILPRYLALTCSDLDVSYLVQSSGPPIRRAQNEGTQHVGALTQSEWRADADVDQSFASE